MRADPTSSDSDNTDSVEGGAGAALIFPPHERWFSRWSRVGHGVRIRSVPRRVARTRTARWGCVRTIFCIFWPAG